MKKKSCGNSELSGCLPNYSQGGVKIGLRLLEPVELYSNPYLPARTALDEKETGRLIDLLDNAVSLMTQIGKRLNCCNIATSGQCLPILRMCKMLCFAGPIGLYLHQPDDPQLNENARSRWRLLQCTMDSMYPEAAGANSSTT